MFKTELHGCVYIIIHRSHIEVGQVDSPCLVPQRFQECCITSIMESDQIIIDEPCTNHGVISGPECFQFVAD